ncbi:ParB/RepB/Spo0J family partition protein [Lentzea sp. NPDC006480]|uniref:ParB/RepB/Spo0J family partition protein n=1 Tax=Lentzea sp. NPDC006480 TaxID=3157176 RepID=UPI0033AB7AED
MRNQGVERGDQEQASPWCDYQAGVVPTEMVAISRLRLGGSPRTTGVTSEHVRVLARTNSRVPPIIVHRRTMCVIDGVQRVRAAELNGRDHIEAQFFDGDEHDAFVLAVEANTANGLPLSVADRKAAAARIITTHPARSDRWIALVSGLTASTVGEIRRRSTVDGARSNTRIGRDGRRRPLDSSDGRRLAGELMRADPDRSLRDIAKAAGIAPSTVLDVRNRISCGEDPVPPPRKDPAEPDPVAIMRTLCKDPSLRLTEAGRALLRWLDTHTVTGEAAPPVQDIPAHCAGAIAELARHNARFWTAFADRVSDQG